MFGVKKHYLTIAPQNLKNRKHPVAGKKKETREEEKIKNKKATRRSLKNKIQQIKNSFAKTKEFYFYSPLKGRRATILALLIASASIL